MGESISLDKKAQREGEGSEQQFREPFSPKTFKYAWRRKLAANPVSNHTYRVAVAVVGFIVVAAGAAAIPLPGPGWLIVFLGLGIWATEFMWAARLLNFARGKVDAWNQWLKRQPWWVQGLVALATFAFVLFVLWVTMKVGGIPTMLPDSVEDFLRTVPGLP